MYCKKDVYLLSKHLFMVDKFIDIFGPPLYYCYIAFLARMNGKPGGRRTLVQFFYLVSKNQKPWFSLCRSIDAVLFFPR
ncbi:MAG: hypothetical protein JWQ09_3415 [Segetibacter sp.]|nr:hypothetical protein [Segetibacter sp.]